MKSLTSTQQMREAIAGFRGKAFALVDLKHIYSYSSMVANLLAMDEIDEIGEKNGKKVFKATAKLKPWDYQHSSHTDRKYKSKAFHKALKEQSTPAVVKNVSCAGWRDVTPFLFNDPYYKVKGKVTSVART